jgi:hypothetical protein
MMNIPPVGSPVTTKLDERQVQQTEQGKRRVRRGRQSPGGRPGSRRAKT